MPTVDEMDEDLDDDADDDHGTQDGSEARNFKTSVAQPLLPAPDVSHRNI